MRILVTGGTGVLGRELVREADGGYTVRVMSRRDPKTNPWPHLEWAQADLRTGRGLQAAVTDVQTIIHAATSPLLHPNAVDVEGTRRLLEQARAVGVAHFVYISIVGVDQIPFPYYKRKYQAERLVREAGIPWSILRVTQFHTLIDQFLQPLTWLPMVLFPTDFKSQPIDPGVVAERVCKAVVADPAGYLPNLGGPKVHTFGEMAQVWMAARGLRRRLIRLHIPGKAAQGFRLGLNTCPEHKDGRITWADWLQRKYGHLRP